MDWDQARIFLAVSRSGQMLAAARQLALNHAIVSRRISQLEGDIGAQLRPGGGIGCLHDYVAARNPGLVRVLPRI